MEHPLKDKKVIYYGGLWVLIMTLHATFLFYQFTFSLSICIADSLLNNVSIAVACFLYWYVVKFISPKRQGMSETLISHVIGIVFIVFVITQFCGYVLKMVFDVNTAYHQFIHDSILFRALLGTLYFSITVL